MQRIAFVLVALLGVATVCQAQDTARMDQIVRSYVDAGHFAGAVLVARGKLKIDDLVKTHLPEAPAAWDRVTLFHLLTHTAGFAALQSPTTGRQPPVESPDGTLAGYVTALMLCWREGGSHKGAFRQPRARKSRLIVYYPSALQHH